MSEIIEQNKKKAFKLYHKLDLPMKSEEWKYTNTKNIVFDEKNGSENIEFVINDKDQKKGVVFCDINTAISKHFDILSKHLPMSLIETKDKFLAMHGAFWNTGVFIYVPKNVSLDLPLRNKFIITKKGNLFSHTTIVVEENSKLNYVEEHLSETAGLKNCVVEIYAKKNSKINFFNFQNWKHKVTNVTNWKAKLGRDAKINWYLGQFGGELSRIKIDTVLEGEGSESNSNCVFFGTKKQHFDITTNNLHVVENTSGNILVKGVLDDFSTSVVRGMIKIKKEAQHTNSFLSDHSLILGGNAVSNSVPSLEIDANDVKASHSATLGRPDEKEIFYLMARGLPRKDAERLIVLGYFSPIIENININDLKDRFEDVLKEKIGGDM